MLLASATKQAALMTGVVDAMSGYYTTQAGAIERETKKKVAWIRYADFGVNAITLGLIINTKHADERMLNCKMVRATTRAWAAAVRDPDGVVEALHQLFPHASKGDKDLTREQWLQTVPLLQTKNSNGKALGWIAREDWENLLKLLKGQGGMDRVKPAADYYTNDFFDCT